MTTSLSEQELAPESPEEQVAADEQVFVDEDGDVYDIHGELISTADANHETIDPFLGDFTPAADASAPTAAGVPPTMGPTTGAGDEEAAANAEPMTPLQIQQLEEDVIDAMRTVYDPEIPVNIYELGLIYELNIDTQGRALVEMTLTSPACPVAGILPGEVEQKVLSVDGVNVAKVELVWDPPWSTDMMSEAAQLQLGFF